MSSTQIVDKLKTSAKKSPFTPKNGEVGKSDLVMLILNALPEEKKVSVRDLSEISGLPTKDVGKITSRLMNIRRISRRMETEDELNAVLLIEDTPRKAMYIYWLNGVQKEAFEREMVHQPWIGQKKDEIEKKVVEYLKASDSLALASTHPDILPALKPRPVGNGAPTRIVDPNYQPEPPRIDPSTLSRTKGVVEIENTAVESQARVRAPEKIKSKGKISSKALRALSDAARSEVWFDSLIVEARNLSLEQSHIAKEAARLDAEIRRAEADTLQQRFKLIQLKQQAELAERSLRDAQREVESVQRSLSESSRKRSQLLVEIRTGQDKLNEYEQLAKTRSVVNDGQALLGRGLRLTNDPVKLSSRLAFIQRLRQRPALQDLAELEAIEADYAYALKVARGSN